MSRISNLIGGLLLLMTLAPVGAAWAQWELAGDKSSVNFVSIKNSSVAELHSFETLMGFIAEDGSVQVSIDLASVQTMIDIRDERMREMLFETARFPAAKATAEVDPAVIQAVVNGGTVTTDVPVTLSMHGAEQTLTASLVVVGESDGPLRVFSAHPILLDASDFGLVEGVNALREIAGLGSISTAIPVTLHLVFEPAH